MLIVCNPAGARTSRQVILRTVRETFHKRRRKSTSSAMVHLVSGRGRFHAHSTNWIFHRGRRSWGIFHSHNCRLRETPPNHIRFIRLYNRLLYRQAQADEPRPHCGIRFLRTWRNPRLSLRSRSPGRRPRLYEVAYRCTAPHPRRPPYARSTACAVCGIAFDEAERTVRVEFDASRLKKPVIAALSRADPVSRVKYVSGNGGRRRKVRYLRNGTTFGKGTDVRQGHDFSRAAKP